MLLGADHSVIVGKKRIKQRDSTPRNHPTPAHNPPADFQPATHSLTDD